jgi:predicted HTH transcriptional regulator
MTQIQAFVNNVRQLIGENDLKTALNELQRFLKDSPKLDEMLMHSARFQEVLRHIHLGTIDFDKAIITKNQINKGVLELLREIEGQGNTTLFHSEIQATETIKEEMYEYNTIKKKILLNRGAGTSELLKDKSTDDLEEKELNRFYKMARVMQSFDEEELIMEELTIQKRLIHLGLAENGHIFKGTFLCFGKRHQIQTISHSATESKFIIFKGTNRAHIALLETLNGNIIRQYERMMMLLRIHIPLGRDREKSEDIYEIPMIAIREFISNAFIHRDYSHTVQSYIQVEMYDDRIEIKSPGHLPPNVNVNKIEGTVLINPTIAAIFHLYKYIERAGTGINISQLSLQEHGLKPAIIENVDNPKMVKVTIYREKVKDSAEEETYWQEVTTKNTLLMYNRYLRKYPSGKYVKEADKRLDELENQ